MLDPDAVSAWPTSGNQVGPPPICTVKGNECPELGDFGKSSGVYIVRMRCGNMCTHFLAARS